MKFRSFRSKTLQRIAKRKPLAYFYGILDKESGNRLEKAIIKGRKLRSIMRKSPD